jgi:hypothetical protein
MNSDRFGKTDVSVTLTGEEWFAILARLVNRPLSKQGAATYNKATEKMQVQLLAASDRSIKGLKQ